MSDTVVFKFKLGDKLKDRVTEYQGICDGRRQHLNGCIQYSIQGKFKGDELKAGWWVDEGQIERVNKGLNKEPVKTSTTGGPMERVQR